MLISSANIDRLHAQPLPSKISTLTSNSIVSLDGEWLLMTDPQNVGKNEKWWKKPVPRS